MRLYSKHLSDTSLKGSKRQRLEEAIQIYAEEHAENRFPKLSFPLCILLNTLIATGESILEDLEKLL